MLGELLAYSVQDGAEGVHALRLALQSGPHCLGGGQRPVAALTHRPQPLGPTLQTNHTCQVLEGER